MLDKRLNAFRNDLADVRLKGQVEAPAFRNGVLMQVSEPIATLHRAPAEDAPQETQVLMGETLLVFDMAGGWAWVQLTRDRYVGYLRQDYLSSKIHIATHRVAVPSTLLYTTPSIKTQPVQFLPINAEVAVVAHDGDMIELATGGFVFADHVKSLDTKRGDFVEFAQQFLNTPYLWGGKSYHGIDCSGLVQTALHGCGIACLRDADMQENDLGNALQINDLDGLRRGDLIFWAGHVGIMQDATTLLHASGHQMMVVSEPLSVANERTKAKGKEITRIKRLA